MEYLIILGTILFFYKILTSNTNYGDKDFKSDGYFWRERGYWDNKRTAYFGITPQPKRWQLQLSFGIECHFSLFFIHFGF